MSSYFKKGKGWRYDFIHKGIRYTEAWFKTKKEALRAKSQKEEKLKNPPPPQKIRTDMDFLSLINVRLDYVRAYNSDRHYKEYLYIARRWTNQWKQFTCKEITTDMVERFIIQRSRVSNYVANKEIRYLRATFNFAIKKKMIFHNPMDGMSFLPVEKRIKYTPPIEHIDRIIAEASKDVQDYLWTIRESMGRVSEINRLTWEDVDLRNGYITLYTRKKSGGHLTPRRIWMTEKLRNILNERSAARTDNHPWVFWHRYFSRKDGCWKEGPFENRSKIMKTLCARAGVPYFRYHALRHAGASLMDSINTPIGTIQKILGHENRKTTEIYLHSFNETEKQAIRNYEAARKKSHTDSHTTKKAFNSQMS